MIRHQPMRTILGSKTRHEAQPDAPRDSVTLRGLLLLVFCLPILLPVLGAEELKTKNILLVTVDGLRAQELFEGIDPILLADKEKAGIKDLGLLRKKYWRETPHERRKALLPYFWNTLAPQGIVLGNKALGSRTLLKNKLHFSYPGYAELLTGEPQVSVRSNDKVRIGTRTILEFIRERLDLERTEVAAFASWDVFNFITSSQKTAIFSNAGYETVPAEFSSPEMRQLDKLQHTMLTPWDSVRHDAMTAALARAYVKKHKPRILYLALGETDDWAHERRYDRVIATARLFDQELETLWTGLQSSEVYRDKTTLLITTDHGRGRTTENWTDHGKDVPGAEEIWIAVMGPDTQNLGEIGPTPTVYLSGLAALMLYYLELPYEEYNSEIDSSLLDLMKRSKTSKDE